MVQVQTHSVEIDLAHIQMDKEDIFRILSHQNAHVDSHSRDLVDRYMKQVLNEAAPRGAYGRWNAMELANADEIEVEGLRFRTGKIIRKMLQGAALYAFFIATAGKGPEMLSRKLMEEGNYLEGFIVDLIASFLVDAVADQLHMLIRTEASSLGMKVTNRYSPGYCSWDVSEQQKLFSLFTRNNCGISLSPSSLMSPIKSVSGLIGIGDSVRYREYICDICSMKECQFRKTGS